MTLIQRLVREPNLVLAVITSGLALLVLFGLELTDAQTAGILGFLAALIALIRYLTTPAAEVVAQERPDGTVVAGPAADLPTGDVVEVEVQHADTLPEV